MQQLGINNKKFIIGITILIGFSILISRLPNTQAASNSGSPNQPSSTIGAGTHPSSTIEAGARPSLNPDAIAVRIFDNNNYLSPYDWYKINVGAKRSLQSLIVDGYDAVRDDRTVYVAASNIVPCASGGKECLQPIIAIISFNQNVSNETLDIFGQILNNWHFNQNINSYEGTCWSKPDTPSGINCLTNKDCPSGQYCNSLKSKIIRDTRRLIDLTFIKDKLEQYRTNYQHYPNLEAGSYLINKTLSVWPSWQKTLAVKLNTALPIDPINYLGSCPGYNPNTCWNEQQRSFATSWPYLPTGSRSYQYEYINSTNYRLCANFESNYQNLNTLNLNCAGTSSNSGPIINCPTLRGAAYQAFTGYAAISDSEGDTIRPNISFTPLENWQNLSMQLVDNRRHIKISATSAGPTGRYTTTITAQDSLNNIGTGTCTIIIGGGLCGNNAINTGEDCDGEQGIAHSAIESSPYKQYACNEYCRFTGGWCGDNIVQNGDNYTLNLEQCDGSLGIAYRTSDSNINRQYGCLHCQFTGGYCGDHIVQTSTNSLINEECDHSETLMPQETYGGSQQYYCGQPGTINACRFAGGYCGNGIVESNYEQCEPASYSTPTPADSSSNHQYLCGTNCATYDGYCGDGTVNANHNEICDPGSYITPKPASSSPTNQYVCGSDCVTQGGYCGDYTVQYEESCEPIVYITPTPANSSLTHQYRCTNCVTHGGYCGDGTVNTAYGEICDPGSYGTSTPASSTPTHQYVCGSDCVTHGGYCGDGTVNTAYGETCDPNALSSWNPNTEFCDSVNCQKGTRLRILQIIPDGTNLNLAKLFASSTYQDNIITQTATVTTTTLAHFNTNSTTYIPTTNPTQFYNVLVFGFKDCNNSQDLNTTSASTTKKFIQQGGGVIFGHDTIWQHGNICGGTHSHFNSLAPYAGINVASYTNDTTFSSVKKYPTSTSSELMFTTPYSIPSTFSVSPTHNSGAVPSSTLCSATNPNLLRVWYVKNTASATPANFWAITCGRVEHILLGHTATSTSMVENRALINMLYYVATH